MESEKTEKSESPNTESQEVGPLDKVIIKKREKKDDRKSREGRDLGTQ